MFTKLPTWIIRSTYQRKAPTGVEARVRIFRCSNHKRNRSQQKKISTISHTEENELHLLHTWSGMTPNVFQQHHHHHHPRMWWDISKLRKTRRKNLITNLNRKGTWEEHLHRRRRSEWSEKSDNSFRFFFIFCCGIFETLLGSLSSGGTYSYTT